MSIASIRHTRELLTYLSQCTVYYMINAEMLLNASWFMDGRLATSLSEVDSEYWIELQACVSRIQDVFLDVVYVA